MRFGWLRAALILQFPPLPPLRSFHKSAFFRAWLTHDTSLCILRDNTSTLSAPASVTRSIFPRPPIRRRRYFNCRGRRGAMFAAPIGDIFCHRHRPRFSWWSGRFWEHMSIGMVISVQEKMLLKEAYHVKIREVQGSKWLALNGALNIWSYFQHRLTPLSSFLLF